MPTRRLLVLIALSVAVAACTENVVSTEPVLEGIAFALPLDYENQVEGVSVTGDAQVDVFYLVGTCGGETDALDQARAYQARYYQDEIVLLIDGSVDCPVTNDIGFLRRSRLVLTEEIGDRPIRLEDRALLPRSGATCDPDEFASGMPNPDAMAEPSGDIEVWGLFYPARPPDPGDPVTIRPERVWAPEEPHSRFGTKVVWRATGDGEFEVSARGPSGRRVDPFFLEEHAGSQWDRPGGEWGSGWDFDEPGCWTFTVSRGLDTASITVEVRFIDVDD